VSDSLSFAFLLCLLAAAGLVILLFRQQTAYMGVTCLFAFQVSSASLSAFSFGRVFGLREQWITPDHESVFLYSGWACLAIVGAMWLAWLHSKNHHANKLAQAELFPWVTERFVFFALGLGAIGTIALPFLARVPTVGTATHLLASWLKLGLITAVILFKKKGNLRPLLIAVALYIPAAAVCALSSGFTPFSVDAIICIALIATCLNRVTIFSFIKLFICMVPCVYLMFGWLASRGIIRSGELEGFPIAERATRFADVFVDELLQLHVTAYDVQTLLFDRIDMSDILAQEVAFQISPSGEDQFAYGGTLVDGLVAVVPRALWEDKPTVAGYADFVGQYTGVGPRSDNTSIGVPVQFELYANGGPPFVVAGIFILFYLCARLERFVATCRRSLHVLMPSLMFLMSFANGIEQIMLVLSTALAGAATVFVIARIVEVFYPQLLPQFRPSQFRRRLGPAIRATA